MSGGVIDGQRLYRAILRGYRAEGEGAVWAHLAVRGSPNPLKYGGVRERGARVDNGVDDSEVRIIYTFHSPRVCLAPMDALAGLDLVVLLHSTCS